VHEESRGMDVFNRLLKFIIEASFSLNFMNKRRARLDKLNYIRLE
jgi:hypothetical protein